MPYLVNVRQQFAAILSCNKHRSTGGMAAALIASEAFCIAAFPVACCSMRLSSGLFFLLLARYVPRGVYKISVSLTDRRPTNDRLTSQGSNRGKFQMAISPQGVVCSTSCLVLRWGFRVRRIKWRYFRFRQIQDGGLAAILENSAAFPVACYSMRLSSGLILLHSSRLCR